MLIYTLQLTVTHALGFSVFTGCILPTDFNTVITPIITYEVFSSQADFQISTELVAISSQSYLPATQRNSLNYHSAGLRSSLYTLGADPTENTVSIVIAQQYLNCCLFIPCRGNLFTESLPSNERLLWLHYSGFQASCHNIINNVIFIEFQVLLVVTMKSTIFWNIVKCSLV
jgi:hypothetical protein